MVGDSHSIESMLALSKGDRSRNCTGTQLFLPQNNITLVPKGRNEWWCFRPSQNHQSHCSCLSALLPEAWAHVNTTLLSSAGWRCFSQQQFSTPKLVIGSKTVRHRFGRIALLLKWIKCENFQFLLLIKTIISKSFIVVGKTFFHLSAELLWIFIFLSKALRDVLRNLFVTKDSTLLFFNGSNLWLTGVRGVKNWFPNIFEAKNRLFLSLGSIKKQLARSLITQFNQGATLYQNVFNTE